MSDVLLSVRNLTYRFQMSKKTYLTAVDDISFDIKKGEIFGLVGESGSGKSTVARCIMNLYQPTAGEIWYKDINVCDRKEFRSNKKILQRKDSLFFRIHLQV